MAALLARSVLPLPCVGASKAKAGDVGSAGRMTAVSIAAAIIDQSSGETNGNSRNG
jgi:hypothetical protein